MLVSSLPVKFNVPWASGAGGGFITEPIPVTTTAPGRASLTLGFPPTTFEPEASGGNPPFGADANGILNQATAWLQWAQAGGPVAYDATFQAAISGYPNGALIQAAAGGHYWQSTADNNTTNPDTGGAGWLDFPGVIVQKQAGNFTATDTGAVNAAAITLTPAPASWAAIVGAPLRFIIAFTNTTTTVTLNVNGLGTKTLKNIDGTAMVIGQLTAGGIVEGFYDGTNVQVAAPGKPASAPPPAAAIPTGAIILCPVEVPFFGTLECNGASYLRSTYPNLFNVIGTRYGAVDSNHFSVPDMRGIFVRGWDHGRGLDVSSGSRAAPGVLAPPVSGATGAAGDHVGTTEAFTAGPINLTGAPAVLNNLEFFCEPVLISGWTGANQNFFLITPPPGDGTPAAIAPLLPGTDAVGNIDKIRGNLDLSGNSGSTETRPVNINMMYVIVY